MEYGQNPQKQVQNRYIGSRKLAEQSKTGTPVVLGVREYLKDYNGAETPRTSRGIQYIDWPTLYHPR